MQISVNSPTTFYIKFTKSMPRYFSLTDRKGKLYYFRYLDGKTPRIKINIPDSGTYTGNHDFEIVKQTGIEIPSDMPKLPPAERDRWHSNPDYIYNPDLKGTPARCFSEIGVIELSPQFYSFPKPIQEFIRLHEVGHFFYKTEEYCDLWALVNYLREGYNRSMAFYALNNILMKTPANVKRIEELINNIYQTQKKYNELKGINNRKK